MGDDDSIVDDSDDNLGSELEPESENDNDHEDSPHNGQDRLTA
jgi:hypothetical protein